MKKIRLKEIQIGDKSRLITKLKKHSVFLGNGLTFYFTNIHHAEEFLVKTSRFLNFKLFEINEIYIDTRAMYRRNWFYLDGNACKLNNFQFNNNFINIEKAFDRICGHYKDYYVFKDFNNINDSLVIILKQLINLKRSMNNYAEIHQIETIISRIQFIDDQIRNYGKNSP